MNNAAEVILYIVIVIFLGFMGGLMGWSGGIKNVFDCLDHYTLHECQIKFDAIKEK